MFIRPGLPGVREHEAKVPVDGRGQPRVASRLAERPVQQVGGGACSARVADDLGQPPQRIGPAGTGLTASARLLQALLRLL